MRRTAVLLTLSLLAVMPASLHATAVQATTAPTVTVTGGPVDALAQLTLTFSEPVTGLSPSTVTLAERDSGKPLTIDVNCPMPNSTGFEQDCLSANAPTTTAWIVVRDSVLAGQYFVLKFASTVVGDTGQPLTPQAIPMRGLTALTAFNLAQSWPTLREPGTVSGSYRRSNEAGASMFLVATTDQEAQLHVLQGPNQGIATVTWLNQVHTLDLYAPTASERTVALTAQTSGPCDFICMPSFQTVTINVTGRKDRRSTGRWVSVDAFTVNGSIGSLRQLWPEITPGQNGMFATAVKGATASRSFRARQLTWLTRKGPDEGSAALYVDGKRRATVDDYAPTVRRAGYRLTFPDGVHTFKVVNLGKHDRRSRGTRLTIAGLRLA